MIKNGETDNARWYWLLGGGIVGLIALSLVFRDEVEETASAVKDRIMNLFASKDEFVHRLFDSLSRVAVKFPGIGTAQKTILVAQAIHEAGWGVASASKKGFNYWNLTAGPYWKGPIVLGPDTEYDKAGNVKNITQKFRQYGSDDEGTADMLRFIGPNTRYAKAWAKLLEGDAMGYLAELHAAGFYTQPLPLYQAAVKDTIKTVVQTLG